jgi:hypothetical protein
MRRSITAGLRDRTTAPKALIASLLALGAIGPAASSSGSGRGDGGDLPRGGDRIFPKHRVVAFYGAPQSPELGELGIGSARRAAARLRAQARPYGRLGGKRILPAFELIASIALDSPGADGLYRARQPARVIRRYLRVARRERLLLLLDLQPGRSTFIREARRLKPFLRHPNVGLALDPEWNMGPDGVPGERVGSADARAINRVSRLMARIVRRRRLPQKLLVVHQFTEAMVRGEGRLEARRNVAVVMNADGFGTQAQKRAKYRQLAPPRRSPLEPGVKLFYREDTDLMSPRQVLDLDPTPRFVVYE